MGPASVACARPSRHRQIARRDRPIDPPRPAGPSGCDAVTLGRDGPPRDRAARVPGRACGGRRRAGPGLGPASSAGSAARGTRLDGTSRAAATTRARRDLLLPALHAAPHADRLDQPPALNYISRRLAVPPAEAYGVATFYALYALEPRPPVVGPRLRRHRLPARRRGAHLRGPEAAFGRAGEPTADGDATWLRSPCLGLCERAPAMLYGRRRIRASSVGELDGAGPSSTRSAGARRWRTRSGSRPRGLGPGRPSRSSRSAASIPQAGAAAAAARARRPRGPDVARRLPRARRLRALDAGARDRPRGRHRAR